MMICAEKPGGPEVLQWKEKQLTVPNKNEVLIKQKRIGLNYIDIYMTSGLYPFPENEMFVSKF